LPKNGNNIEATLDFVERTKLYDKQKLFVDGRTDGRADGHLRPTVLGRPKNKTGLLRRNGQESVPDSRVSFSCCHSYISITFLKTTVL